MGEERPDLVHVHSRGGIDLFGGLAAHHARAAAVVTRRVDSHEPAFWLRLKYRPYAKIVAISARIESQLVTGARIDAQRVARIASAVDTSSYRPAPAARNTLLERMGLDTEAVVIGMAGQLIARKGHRLLLDSLPSVLDAHPRARVLLFGRGPLEAAIRRRIETLGIAGRARLVGYRDDFVELLPGLDLLVHPAQREGMGSVVLEALACGVPVIASRVGGIVDVIEDGVHGVLVSPEEPRLLGRAISAMIADAGTRRSLAQAGRQRVREHFSVESMTTEYKALYASVLSP
jgi:glycosyltransferase involved in cell wall biosynthesis